MIEPPPKPPLSSAEKFRQLQEVFELGLALKAASLRARHPNLTDAEREVLFRRWLAGDD